MGNVQSGESAWTDTFGCCGAPRNNNQQDYGNNLADRFRNAKPPDGSKRGRGGGKRSKPAPENPGEVETWFFTELQEASNPARPDPAEGDQSDDDTDYWDEDEDGGVEMNRFTLLNKDDKESSLKKSLHDGSKLADEDVRASKALLRKVVKQAGEIKDRKVRNIWQGRGKVRRERRGRGIGGGGGAGRGEEKRSVGERGERRGSLVVAVLELGRSVLLCECECVLVRGVACV